MAKTKEVQKSPLMRLYRKPSPNRKYEKDNNSLSLTDDEKGTKYSNNSSGDDNCRELQAVFDYMDANRDGKISPDELQTSVKTLGGDMSEEEAESAVRLSDLDGDGFLDFGEFQKLMEGNGCTEEEKTSELKGAFGMYADEDKECITPASLKRMLGKLGDSRTTEDCKAMICAFDLNSDGVLSFDEFALMMR